MVRSGSRTYASKISSMLLVVGALLALVAVAELAPHRLQGL
jgi:hypothetical protein